MASGTLKLCSASTARGIEDEITEISVVKCCCCKLSVQGRYRRYRRYPKPADSMLSNYSFYTYNILQQFDCSISQRQHMATPYPKIPKLGCEHFHGHHVPSPPLVAPNHGQLINLSNVTMSKKCQNVTIQFNHKNTICIKICVCVCTMSYILHGYP